MYGLIYAYNIIYINVFKYIYIYNIQFSGFYMLIVNKAEKQLLNM